ncbi:guanylate kinase [Patescibacteria group bacterium]|nr:guanylate kinase [Patescibacteria group bacterium]
MVAKNRLQDKLIVLAGPAAVGRGTLAKELAKWLPVKKIIATTTRPIRIGEKRGVDYHFVDNARFEALIEQDLLITYVEYSKQYYGWLRSEMKKPIALGLVPLLVAGPKEAIKIQRHFPTALTIFLKPDSITTIKKRLMEQGGSTDEMEERVRFAKETLSKATTFGYSVVNTDGKFDDTVRTIKRIIKSYLGL